MRIIVDDSHLFPRQSAASPSPSTPEQSEQANLHGQKAKTPVIAGSTCGAVMALAWIIGFAIYFRKRYRRRKANLAIAAGKAPPRADEFQPNEKIIIPPDPAVLTGQRAPGERVDRAKSHSRHDSVKVEGTTASSQPEASKVEQPPAQVASGT